MRCWERIKELGWLQRLKCCNEMIQALWKRQAGEMKRGVALLCKRAARVALPELLYSSSPDEEPTEFMG